MFIIDLLFAIQNTSRTHQPLEICYGSLGTSRTVSRVYIGICLEPRPNPTTDCVEVISGVKYRTVQIANSI